MGTLVVGLSLCGSALGQVPAPGVAPPPPPAPLTSAAPAAAPTAPAPGPKQGAVPPGYMLVPIPDASPTTQYDVQYPQARGALPPGMELPYEEGEPIPQGYRLVEQKRRGLIIAGSLTAGIPWAFSLTAATAANFDNKSGYLVVPVLGPWLMLLSGGAKDRKCGVDDFCDGNRSSARAVLVLDGLAQTAGAAMFVVGMLVPRKRLLRSDVIVSVLPTPLGRDGYGLGAVGTF